jgi:hypothetical protein
MSAEGRQWLYRIFWRLNEALAIEEDLFWKMEMLRALILVHQLRHTGRWNLG